MSVHESTTWQWNQEFLRSHPSARDEWYLFGIVAQCAQCKRMFVHVPIQCDKCAKELDR